MRIFSESLNNFFSYGFTKFQVLLNLSSFNNSNKYFCKFLNTFILLVRPTQLFFEYIKLFNEAP